MNETQEKMLSERGVIVLPEEINHQAYVDFLSLLLLAESVWQDKSIRLFCAGQGGSAPDAIAIADLVRHHGRINGMLAGEAKSSHVTIWASCSRRYVYELATIGVHCLQWSSLNTRQDRISLRQRDDELMVGEANIARILADACYVEYGHAFWLAAMREAGSDGVRTFNSPAVIKMGMAKPIEAYNLHEKPISALAVVGSLSVNGSE